MEFEFKDIKPQKPTGAFITQEQQGAHQQTLTAWNSKKQARFAELQRKSRAGNRAAEIGAAVGAAIRAAQEGRK